GLSDPAAPSRSYSSAAQSRSGRQVLSYQPLLLASPPVLASGVSALAFLVPRRASRQRYPVFGGRSRSLSTSATDIRGRRLPLHQRHFGRAQCPPVSRAIPALWGR